MLKSLITRRTLTCCICAGMLLASATLPATARHLRHRRAAASAQAASRNPAHAYSWEKDGIDLSPVTVEAFVLPTANPSPTVTQPGVSLARANFLRRMHLENGAKSKGTNYITNADIRSRDLFILQVTQSLEGGFDSVNMYDRGILSWGLMQWTAWTGSLPRALSYMKARLAQTHRERIWDKVFVANGIDVAGDRLVIYGKTLANEQDLRLAFRGTAKPGQYDPKLVNHWITTMARAGRQSDIAQLEIEYAAHVVDGVMLSRFDLPYHSPGRTGVTPADLAGNDPYAEALIFALWTNNPKHAMEYVEDAARAARSVSISDDPAFWTPGAFSSALLRKCQSSRFGNWQARAAMIETRSELVRTSPPSALCPFEQQYQFVLAARKARRFMELASRHETYVRTQAARAVVKMPRPVEVASRVVSRLPAMPERPLPLGAPSTRTGAAIPRSTSPMPTRVPAGLTAAPKIPTPLATTPLSNSSDGLPSSSSASSLPGL